MIRTFQNHSENFKYHLQIRTPTILANPSSFHVSRLHHFTPDLYNQPLPRVTLHVHGDNWEINIINRSQLINGRLEYQVNWKLPEGTFQELWELESRVLNEAPKKVKQFHCEHPSAPKRLSNIDFRSLKFTEPVDQSLPTKHELQNLFYKTDKWANVAAVIPSGS